MGFFDVHSVEWSGGTAEITSRGKEGALRNSPSKNFLFGLSAGCFMCVLELSHMSREALTTALSPLTSAR